MISGLSSANQGIELPGRTEEDEAEYNDQTEIQIQRVQRHLELGVDL